MYAITRQVYSFNVFKIGKVNCLFSLHAFEQNQARCLSIFEFQMMVCDTSATGTPPGASAVIA